MTQRTHKMSAHFFWVPLMVDEPWMTARTNMETELNLEKKIYLAASTCPERHRTGKHNGLARKLSLHSVPVVLPLTTLFLFLQLIPLSNNAKTTFRVTERGANLAAAATGRPSRASFRFLCTVTMCCGVMCIADNRLPPPNPNSQDIQFFTGTETFLTRSRKIHRLAATENGFLKFSMTLLCFSQHHSSAVPWSTSGNSTHNCRAHSPGVRPYSKTSTSSPGQAALSFYMWARNYESCNLIVFHQHFPPYYCCNKSCTWSFGNNTRTKTFRCTISGIIETSLSSDWIVRRYCACATQPSLKVASLRVK